jgi:hypothetical protein
MREFILPLPEHFTVVDDFGDWTNYYTADQMDDYARDAALLVLDAVCALLPADPVYMDPPDGGNVSVLEQVGRMAEDAAKWRAAGTGTACTRGNARPGQLPAGAFA